MHREISWFHYGPSAGTLQIDTLAMAVAESDGLDCETKSTSLIRNRSQPGRFPEVLQFNRVLGYPDPEIPTLCKISLQFKNGILRGIELLECLLYGRRSVGADLFRN